MWYLGVQKGHPLNDSAHGARWGVYGLWRQMEGSKARWYNESNQKLTKRNADPYVQGSPNPYAVALLVHVMSTSVYVRQHEAMPCANLFDTQYCHNTHPATLLIYKTLGFDRAPGLDFYQWSERDSPVALSERRMRLLMRLGLPVVSRQPSQRFLDDGGGNDVSLFSTSFSS